MVVAQILITQKKIVTSGTFDSNVRVEVVASSMPMAEQCASASVGRPCIAHVNVHMLRKAHGHERAVWRTVCCLHRSPVGERDGLDDREPEPGSPIDARTRVVGTTKPLERVRKEVGREAG